MANQQATYTVGQVVQISVAFADASGAALDPDTVTLLVRDPSQMVQVFASGDITRDGVGAYHYDWDTALLGTHHYRWEGISPNCAGEGAFVAVTTL